MPLLSTYRHINPMAFFFSPFFGSRKSQEYLTDPVRVKVGKVSSPTANVSQILEKVPENEKVCLCLHSIDEECVYAAIMLCKVLL